MTTRRSSSSGWGGKVGATLEGSQLREALQRSFLLRQPSTWTSHEAAHWARMAPGEYGAGLDWLGEILERNCIDGSLLLLLGHQEMAGNLKIDDPGQRQAVLEAVARAEDVYQRVRAGSLILPNLTRDDSLSLGQGRIRASSDALKPAAGRDPAASSPNGPAARPAVRPHRPAAGRTVTLSTREAILLAAERAAAALANTNRAARPGRRVTDAPAAPTPPPAASAPRPAGAPTAPSLPPAAAAARPVDMPRSGSAGEAWEAEAWPSVGDVTRRKVLDGLSRLRALRESYDLAARDLKKSHLGLLPLPKRRRDTQLAQDQDSRPQAAQEDEQSQPLRHTSSTFVHGEDGEGGQAGFPSRSGSEAEKEPVPSSPRPPSSSSHHGLRSRPSTPTSLEGLLARSRELVEAAEASSGSKDLLDLSGDATPPESSSAEDERAPPREGAEAERGRSWRRQKQAWAPGGAVPLLAVALDGAAPRHGAAPQLAAGSIGKQGESGFQWGQYLTELDALPYSRHVAWTRPPLLHGTSDPATVHKVLSLGASRTVHHTLKSQLAEDEVRHAHGLPPRAAALEGGLSHSWAMASTPASLKREVFIRESRGLPVHEELRQGALQAMPRRKWSAKAPPARRSWQAAPDSEGGTARATEGSLLPAGRRSGAAARRQSRSESPARSHRHSTFQPARSQSLPPLREAPEGRQRQRQRRSGRKNTDLPRLWHAVDGTFGDPGLVEMASRALDMLDRRLPGGPSSRGVGGMEPALYSFHPGGSDLKYVGRRPPFSLRPEEPVYPLTGHGQTIEGGPMTKSRAQPLAWLQHPHTRGYTELHRSAGLGDPSIAVDWRLRRVALSPLPASDAEAAPADQGSRSPLRMQARSSSPQPSSIGRRVSGLRMPSRFSISAAKPALKSPGEEVHIPDYVDYDYLWWARSRSLAAARLPGGRGPAGFPDPVPSVDARNAAGETALHRASGCRAEAVPLARDLGGAVIAAPAVAASKGGRSSAGSGSRIASSSGVLAAMAHLLALGADPGAKDQLGLTPLHTVFVKGCWMPHGMERVRLLLDAGADPNATDVMGETVLHKAIHLGISACAGPHPDRSHRLRGANHGLTTAQLLKLPGRPPESDLLGLKQLTELLILHGLDIHLKNRWGQTALQLAALRPHHHGPGDDKCSIKVLLKCGADPNCQDLGLASPLHALFTEEGHARGLHLADGINHFKMAHSHPKMPPRCLIWAASLLLRHGASPSLPDASGTTPLHLAVLASSAPLAALLLRFQADPLARDATGASPAGLAVAMAAASMRNRQREQVTSAVCKLLLSAVPGGHLPQDEQAAAWGKAPLPFELLLGEPQPAAAGQAQRLGGPFNVVSVPPAGQGEAGEARQLMRDEQADRPEVQAAAVPEGATQSQRPPVGVAVSQAGARDAAAVSLEASHPRQELSTHPPAPATAHSSHLEQKLSASDFLGGKQEEAAASLTADRQSGAATPPQHTARNVPQPSGLDRDSAARRIQAAARGRAARRQAVALKEERAAAHQGPLGKEQGAAAHQAPEGQERDAGRQGQGREGQERGAVAHDGQGQGSVEGQQQPLPHLLEEGLKQQQPHALQRQEQPLPHGPPEEQQQQPSSRPAEALGVELPGAVAVEPGMPEDDFEEAAWMFSQLSARNAGIRSSLFRNSGIRGSLVEDREPGSVGDPVNQEGGAAADRDGAPAEPEDPERRQPEEESVGSPAASSVALSLAPDPAAGRGRAGAGAGADSMLAPEAASLPSLSGMLGLPHLADEDLLEDMDEDVLLAQMLRMGGQEGEGGGQQAQEEDGQQDAAAEEEDDVF